MRTSFLVLALTSCLADETGIDHTVLTGTITIPPALLEEARANGTLALAQGLGTDGSTGLSYRTVVVTGGVDSWLVEEGTTYGDPDFYAFSPVADGPFTLGLTFATSPAAGTDTAGGSVDADVFLIELVDLAAYDAATGAGVLLSETTDGSGGVWAAEPALTAGTDYALLVAGIVTDENVPLPYTLTLSGSTPSDATVLVGAYAGSDPAVAESPLGGTNATGWAYDAATLTWSATWRMMWLRSVTNVEDEDTDDVILPAAEVVEGAGTVFLRGGTLATLNAAPAAGTLYASTSLSLDAKGAATAPDPVVLDTVAPKLIGQQVAEAVPDVTLAEIDPADYTLIEATLAAQDMGMLTGLGYVDIVSGSSLLDPAMSGWNGTNDSDAFAFTVPETMNVRMTAGWPDPAADIDFGIWYPDADSGLIDLFSTWGDSYCLTGSNPEICESAVTLEPDITYYLVALGYLGTDEQPYTVELEWLAP